jgi:triosephosphate isomerase
MKKPKKIIVGNWKMNPATPEEAHKIFTGIERGLLKIGKIKNVQAVICPSFLHYSLLEKYNKKAKVSLGVQNIFNEEKGSFTGEISVDMVKSMGAKYIIVGHSERRKLGETDALVNKKIHLALERKLIPIICIGEEKRDEEGHYLTFIQQQLGKTLKGVTVSQLKNIIIAYEPIFAIGATEAMNAHDVHSMTIFIKKTLFDLYRTKSLLTTVIYGGAVDPTNAQGLLTKGDADGFLIGRQSLDVKSFLEILHIASDIK